MRILLVTNDFPPRVGGIQSYLWEIYRRLAEAGVEVRVLAPAQDGATEHDAAVEAALPSMRILRASGRIWWPSPALAAHVAALAADCDAVALGAVLPMNLSALRTGPPLVVHTHGFEVAPARLPAARSLLRRILGAASLVTVIAGYPRRFVEPLAGGARVMLLRTGADLDRFHPGVDGGPLRARFGLEGRPVVSCVSRLVPRKGQDVLIEAMPAIRKTVPDAAALIVGGGPIRGRLEALAEDRGVADAVAFAGQVDASELPAAYAAGDVFAMPCRSRLGGLEVEGLGLVFVEAQACGRPAVAGDSGGAPEAVVPGETGFVVDGRDPAALAGAVSSLLANPARAAEMGAAGRAFVERAFRWDDSVAAYRAALESLR